jgi:glutaredoxin-like protein
MRYLSATLRKQLGEIFRELPRPVTLLVFTGADSEGTPCETCDEARDLIQEIASISDGRVRAELYDVEKDAAMASIYSIDKTPAIVVLGDESSRRDFGIRFFGAPAGYELATLIEDIRMASTGETELRKETVDALTHLTSPLHLQVFVTPSCPYCPRARCCWPTNWRWSVTSSRPMPWMRRCFRIWRMNITCTACRAP